MSFWREKFLKFFSILRFNSVIGAKKWKKTFNSCCLFSYRLLSTFHDCPPPLCRPSTQFVKCLLFSIRRLFMILLSCFWRVFQRFHHDLVSFVPFSTRGESLFWSLSSVWIKFLSFPLEEFSFCTKNFESCQRVRRKVFSCHKNWRFLAFFTHWIVPEVGNFWYFPSRRNIYKILYSDIVAGAFKEVEKKVFKRIFYRFFVIKSWIMNHIFGKKLVLQKSILHHQCDLKVSC